MTVHIGAFGNFCSEGDHGAAVSLYGFLVTSGAASEGNGLGFISLGAHRVSVKIGGRFL